MTDWQDPVIVVGIAQVIIALTLVYFTISLAKSTQAYSRQVERQTSIMEENNKLNEEVLQNAKERAELERLLKKYERLSTEMVNFIAPLYSRVGDNQVFTSKLPKQKIQEWHGGRIDEIPRETYSFWEVYRQNEYLNQSKEMQMALHNYFSVIDTISSIQSKSPQSEADRSQLNQLMNIFQRDRSFLFDAIRKRYFDIQKELEDLERELGIQEKEKGR